MPATVTWLLRATVRNQSEAETLDGCIAGCTVLRFAELDARKRSFNSSTGPERDLDVLGRPEGIMSIGDQMASWLNAFLAQRRKGATQM